MFLKVFKSIVTKHAYIVLGGIAYIGGARSRNLGGGGIWGVTHIFWGEDRISRNLPPLSKFFTLWIFFPYIPKQNFFPDIFFQTFQSCPNLPKFFSQKSPLCCYGSYSHGSQRRSNDFYRNCQELGGGSNWSYV